MDHVCGLAVVQKQRGIKFRTTPCSFPWSRNAEGKRVGPRAPPSRGPEIARVQILDHAVQFPVAQKSGRQKNWTMRGLGWWSRNRGFKGIGPRTRAPGGPERARVKILDHAAQFYVVQKSGRQKNWTMRGPGRWSKNAGIKEIGPRARLGGGPETARDQIPDHAVSLPWSKNAGFKEIGPRARLGGGPEIVRIKILDHAAQFSVVQKWGI